MGKKGKNKKQKNEEETKVQVTKPQGQEMVTQTDPVDEPVSKEPEVAPVVKSAEERALEYKDSAVKIHESFVNQFKNEEENLNKDPDFDEGLKELDKKEKEELKKLEKIIKKECNSFEDISGPGASNAKMVYDRVILSLNNSRKVAKESANVKKEADDLKNQMDESQNKIQGHIKSKNMLAMICDQFMNQNFDLYLKHEQMLDEEKVKRAELASTFQEKMNKLSSGINSTKEERQKEYQQNSDLRDLIGKAIATYKTKEEEYKAKMEVFNVKIKQFQQNDQMKQCEKEKQKFEGVQQNVQRLSDEIQNYIQKFNSVKDEIEDRGKKFENYKMEIENKRLNIQLLETEIQNILTKSELKEKSKLEIANEKHLLSKQLDTLKNLNNALKVQLQALQ